MKRLILGLGMVALLFSCSSKQENKETVSQEPSSESSAPQIEEVEAPDPNDPMQNKGIGPVKSVSLGANVDEAMAAKGKEIYEAKCTACHKPTKKHIGPAPIGILERRTPEWIMNMILNPEEMIQKDPIAKQLLMEANGSPMANQNLTEEQARQVLEYFRTIK